MNNDLHTDDYIASVKKVRDFMFGDRARWVTRHFCL